LGKTTPVQKGTRLSIFLFGKPAWEIDGLEGGDIDFTTLEKIEALGKQLHAHLQWSAKVARELLDHGWDAYGGLYDLDFYKPIPEELARKELEELGLNPDELNLEEEEFEDESDEGDG
jgi:hypothetical protein